MLVGRVEEFVTKKGKQLWDWSGLENTTRCCMVTKTQPHNVMDRDLESDRDMEHESDTDCSLIDKRYLNNKHSNWHQKKKQALWHRTDEVASVKKKGERLFLLLINVLLLVNILLLLLLILLGYIANLVRPIACRKSSVSWKRCPTVCFRSLYSFFPQLFAARTLTLEYLLTDVGRFKFWALSPSSRVHAISVWYANREMKFFNPSWVATKSRFIIWVLLRPRYAAVIRVCFEVFLV